MNQLQVVSPEIVLLAAACLVSLVGLRSSPAGLRLTHWVAQASLLLVAAMHLRALKAGLTFYVMQGMVVSDPMGHLLALSATVAMMVTLAYAQPYIAARDMLKGEFFSLAMFVLLGISVMVSANNFLAIYVGLEVMSLSLYA